MITHTHIHRHTNVHRNLNTYKYTYKHAPTNSPSLSLHIMIYWCITTKHKCTSSSEEYIGGYRTFPHHPLPQMWRRHHPSFPQNSYHSVLVRSSLYNFGPPLAFRCVCMCVWGRGQEVECLGSRADTRVPRKRTSQGGTFLGVKVVAVGLCLRFFFS